jgi:hypothetical protein
MTRARWLIHGLLLGATLALTPLAFGAEPERPVGVALVLLVDVSGSIDDAEYALQKDGIVEAFRHPQIHRAITMQAHSAIAVTLVMWSDSQVVVVPWTVIDGEASAIAFAVDVDRVRRPSAAGTHLGDALAFGIALLTACPCRPERRAIDVSGDGRGNGGAIDPSLARDDAIAAGIVINGLPIAGSEAGIVEYYRDEVVGESGGFIIEASGFENVAGAMLAKLRREVAMN